MELNPYESPRQGKALEERPMGDSGSVPQLLAEIRDAHREMLTLQREAMQFHQEALRRQQGLTRQSRVIGFVVFILIFASIGFRYYLFPLRPFTPPAPARTPTRVLPQPTPKAALLASPDNQ